MLVKQPNGKFAYIKSNKEVFINLTTDDYKQMRINEAVKALKKELAKEEVYSMADLIQRTRLSEDALKSMGCDMTHDEMMKYIPCGVVDKSFSSRDHTTYGKCPLCGESVQDGVGHRDEKCPGCGQRLKWY